MNMKKIVRLLIILVALASLTGCSLISSLIGEIKNTINDMTTLAEVGQYAPDIANILSGAIDDPNSLEGVTVGEPIIDENGVSTTAVTLDGLAGTSGTYTGALEIIDDPALGITFSTGAEPLTIVGTGDTPDKLLTCDLNFDLNGELSGGTVAVDGEEVNLADYYDTLVSQGLIDPISIGNTGTTETGEGQ